MFRFYQRRIPSANTVLLDGGVLVDPGAGWDVPALRHWLGDATPSLVVNTHWHSDHAGANAAFQADGVPIAAGAAEAARIDARDPDAGRARWLHQWLPPYRVDRTLSAGDVIPAGEGRWTVLALPGHSADLLGLWEPQARALICADALMEADIGWLDLDADPAALTQSEATIEAIAALDPRTALPGHGPAIHDLPAALTRARTRLASWRADPTRIAWHACKRIFTHMLMEQGGLARDDVMPALLACPWLHDHARRAFSVAPAAFADNLIAEMLRARIAGWRGGRLMPLGEHAAIPPDWPKVAHQPTASLSSQSSPR